MVKAALRPQSHMEHEERRIGSANLQQPSSYANCGSTLLWKAADFQTTPASLTKCFADTPLDLRA
jgi:hypothetical protein